MEFTEVTTMLTDYVLAGMGLWFAVALFRREHHPGATPRRLWGVALGCLAVGAVTGGTFHGFRLILDVDTLAALWRVTLYGIGGFMLCATVGSVRAVLAGRARTVVTAVAVVTVATYAVWMSIHTAYIYVILLSVSGMGAIVALHAAAARRGDRAARWLIGGVLVSALAAGIQASGFTLHAHFNHNDLYHVVQMAGLYLLYRGASLLDPAGAGASTGTITAQGHAPQQQAAVD